ncbi:MAG TPA: hypothetical protein VGX70_09180 [Gemmataceae bacterium]|jgi:hypothetical protein|nr:hypothetical protein [Gemmataceae bacterium]
MNRNFRTPYVENWTLGIQHAFSSKLSLDVSYVGNHGVKLPGVVDLNQPALGSGWTPADIAAGVANTDGNEQLQRPYTLNGKFPYLGAVNYLSNFYGSTYHGLQTTLTARNYHGLDFVAGYTFAHAVDDLSSNWVAFLPKDSANPGLEHASGDEDIRHRFTFSITYTLPEKKTKSQLLDGWQLNSIISLQSGQPWNVNDQTFDFSGTGELADRWNFFGNPSDFKSQGPNGLPYFPGLSNQACVTKASALDGTNPAKPYTTSLGLGGCYAHGSSILIPSAIGTFGTMGRNIFRDTGFRNVDFSVTKSFRFGERVKAQFRAEMFNVFNHPEFANPWGATSGYGQAAFADPSVPGQFGCGCATPDGASFNPVLGSGSNRAIQLGLKFIF